MPLLRIMTDRETEYCRKKEHHKYKLYLTIEDIDHTNTKVMSPQTNSICKRLHKILQDEFLVLLFVKKYLIILISFKKIWMDGLSIISKSVLIVVHAVMERLQHRLLQSPKS